MDTPTPDLDDTQPMKPIPEHVLEHEVAPIIAKADFTLLNLVSHDLNMLMGLLSWAEAEAIRQMTIGELIHHIRIQLRRRTRGWL